MWPLLLAIASAVDLPDPGRTVSARLTYDPETREMDGEGTLTWRNDTDAPVDAVPLHLYLNGFEGGASTWMREDRSPRRGSFRAYSRVESEDDPWGWIELDRIEQVVGDARHELTAVAIQPDDGNPWDRSLVQVALAEPVPPGGELTLDLAWSSRLADMMPRSGVVDGFVLGGQTLPELGAQDASGRFAPHQFHNTTEFFGAFADHDVTVSVPEGWLLAGSGGPGQDGKLGLPAIHGFLWVALDAERFTHRVIEHPETTIHLFFPNEVEVAPVAIEDSVTRSLDFLAETLVGYPYDTLTIIVPPEGAEHSEAVEFGGAFLALNGSQATEGFPVPAMRMVEHVAIHELLHQWFHGMLASDEVASSWLDEGFTEYWTGRSLEALYGPYPGSILGRPMSPLGDRVLGHVLSEDSPYRDPLDTPGWLYDRGRWAGQAYSRAPLMLATLEGVWGRERFDEVMRVYVQRHAFGHPTPDDWLAAVRDVAGPDAARLAEDLVRGADVIDVRVDDVRTRTWEAPKGRMPLADEEVEHPGLPFAIDESGGGLWAHVTEAGGGTGGVRVQRLPFTGTPGDDELYESWVRIEGPGLPSLPIDVELTFADGVVVRDVWQGSAVYKQYQLIRPAKLVRVEVDPDGKLALDPTPKDNGWLGEPDDGLATDWRLWMGAAAETLVMGLGWSL